MKIAFKSGLIFLRTPGRSFEIKQHINNAGFVRVQPEFRFAHPCLRVSSADLASSSVWHSTTRSSAYRTSEMSQRILKQRCGQLLPPLGCCFIARSFLSFRRQPPIDAPIFIPFTHEVFWASPVPRRLAASQGRIAFVFLLTNSSSPVALHLSLRTRSYFRLQGRVSP